MKAAEKIYSCEVYKLFVLDGEKRWEWVVANVTDAIRDEVTKFRCKDCRGAVRLQHPGRVPKLSSVPVE